MSLQLPAILSPPTPCIPSPALTVSPLEEVAEVALPLYGSAFGSGLRSPYASSPLHQAVSCSSLLYLWTGSSSPVASHPAFRRRSFLRLRTASVLSDGDFHPTVGAHSQAHDRVGSRRLRTVTLPHHRTCRFQHPAVEPRSSLSVVGTRRLSLACPRSG